MDGKSLVELYGDVVVVTSNHRLSVMGFLGGAALQASASPNKYKKVRTTRCRRNCLRRLWHWEMLPRTEPLVAVWHV